MCVGFKMDVAAYTCGSDVNGLFDPLLTSHTIWAAFVAKQTWYVWHDGGA